MNAWLQKLNPPISLAGLTTSKIGGVPYGKNVGGLRVLHRAQDPAWHF